MPLSKITSNSVSLTTLAASGAATLSSTLGVTGVTTVQAGTAALPALTTTGDTNTGIFFPAADTIAFSEGGAEAMRIDSGGSVRINNTSNATFSAQLNTQFTSAFQCGQYLKVTDTSASQSMFIFGNSSSNAVGSIATSGSATSYNTSATSGIIGVDASTIAINTASSERMRIDSSGLVGIGTTTPSSYGGALVVRKVNTGQGVTNAAAQFSDAVNSSLWIGHTSGAANLVADQALTFGYTNGTTTTENARITTGGNMLIGTTTINTISPRLTILGMTAGYQWSCGPTSGNDSFFIYNQSSVGVYLGYGNTSWSSSSDERVKTTITPFENALEKVYTLRAGTGRYLTDEESVSRSFLIAQDVQAVLPEAVNVQDDEIGTLGLQYTDVIPLLVAAIKELKVINDSQATSIATLTATTTSQAETITALTARVDTQAADIAELKTKAA